MNSVMPNITLHSSHENLFRIGLIGAGIGASRTPQMHINEGQAQNINLTYELIDSDKRFEFDADIQKIFAWVKAEGFAGCNVTFPYKRAIVPYLDGLSEGAQRIGAVNTIVKTGHKWIGHNTDYSGFARAFEEGLERQSLEQVLLLGAGGAGSAVAHALDRLKASKIYIYDQNSASAEALSAEIPSASLIDAPETVSPAVMAIVNATPMGMAKLPGMAIDENLIEAHHLVADIVYFPLETELLRAAKARGAKTLNGAGMAVYQAVHAFELFTGRKPDPNRMRATFDAFIS